MLLTLSHNIRPVRNTYDPDQYSLMKTDATRAGGIDLADLHDDRVSMRQALIHCSDRFLLQL